MTHNIDEINIVNIFDVSFNDMSYTEARKNIYEMIVSESAHQIVLANAHTLNLACSIPLWSKAGCGTGGRHEIAEQLSTHNHCGI